jgi:hypothetical protein
LGCEGAVLVDDQLVEQLVIVKIDASSSNLAPEDRDTVVPAKLDVNLPGQILMVSYAHVGVSGREKD